MQQLPNSFYNDRIWPYTNRVLRNGYREEFLLTFNRLPVDIQDKLWKGWLESLKINYFPLYFRRYRGG